MPVQFLCSQCGQLLSVTRRKIGSAVACPRCAAPVVVPSEEAAAAALQMARTAAPKAVPTVFDEFVVFDDLLPANGAAGEPRPAPAPRTTLDQPAAAPTSDSPQAEAVAAVAGELAAARPFWAQRALDGAFHVSRRMLFAQAAALVSLVALAYFVGYFVGRGRPAEPAGEATAAGGAKLIHVPLKVTYQGPDGKSLRDVGAIVVAMPKGKPLTTKLIAEDLKNATRRDAAIHAATQAGGVVETVARADDDLILTLPGTGNYQLLIVSRQCRWPPERRTPEADVLEMQDLIDNPALFLGRQKYRWQGLQAAATNPPFSCDFGRDGQP